MGAVAVLMNHTPPAWGEKKVVGALFMDVRSAFSKASKAHLGRRTEALEIGPDLTRWTGSFMTDRQVKLVLDGEAGEANPMDTGIPRGSPAAPILFVTYLSGIFDEAERAVPGIRRLSFVDDIGWPAGGKGDEAAAFINWATSNGVAFDNGKTEAAIFRKKKPPPPTTAAVKVGAGYRPIQ